VLVPDFERIELANGAILLLMPQHEVPLIGVTAMLAGGAIADASGREGTASVLAELLEKGAGGRNAYQFADAVDNAGGTLTTAASLERIVIEGEFLAKDAPLMVELLADMVRRPRLTADAFDDVRNREIEFLRAARDSNLLALTSMYGAAALFRSHPYARPETGSEATLTALEHDDVVDYHRKQFGSDRLIVAVSGDFRISAMRALLERAFGDWSRARAPSQTISPPQPTDQRSVLLVDAPNSTQTYFWLGSVGVARDYSHRAALDLVNTLFGGRFTSMLNTELRVKTGLSYSAKSQLRRLREPGSVAVLSYTRKETTRQALDLALDTLDRLHEDGVDQAMLDSARAYVTGQYPLALETATQWAGVIADLEFYGLGKDYINDYGAALARVDLAEARTVIDDVYPTRDDLAIVLVGDATAFRDFAREYGEVTEIEVSNPDFVPRELARSAAARRAAPPD
jgi:predicted Zn-dependent peptidase